MEKFKEKIQEEKKDKNENTENPQKFIIPESEIYIKFSRSSGKGGQNVNKLSTKAEVHWNIDASKTFTQEEKERIKTALNKRINKKGDLIVTSQEERSQLQNRERAIKRLNNLVAAGLIPEKERIPTKLTRAAKERRLKEKKHQAEKKKRRSQKFE